MAFGIDDAIVGSIIGGLFSAGGTIGAGIYAGQSAKQINAANLAQARQLNSESVHLANTAHQREIVDLALAGLNPVLSASGSGSSVPSLQAADLDNPGAHVANGVSSAAKLMNADVLSRLELNSAQVAKSEAEVNNLSAQNDNLKAQNDLIKAQADGQRIQNDSMMMDKVLGRGLARELNNLTNLGDHYWSEMTPDLSRWYKGANNFLGDLSYRYGRPFDKAVYNSASSVKQAVKSAVKSVVDSPSNKLLEKNRGRSPWLNIHLR